MAATKTTPTKRGAEPPTTGADTAPHDLHGDSTASAPEQAFERGYAETLPPHSVPAVPPRED